MCIRDRYVTTEIKNRESKIFQVKNRAAAKEYELFCEVRNLVSSKTKRIRSVAKAIACIDALLGLAITSLENNFINQLFQIMIIRNDMTG